jgi:hypothetical protein
MHFVPANKAVYTNNIIKVAHEYIFGIHPANSNNFQQNFYKLLTLQRRAVKTGNSFEKQNSLAQNRFGAWIAMLTRIIPLRTSCYRFIFR